MSSTQSKNNTAFLTVLCTALYFCSYLTRYNYSAVLVEIVSTEGFGKALASMSLTGLFVTYGAGQLISGFLGDRIAPQHIIFAGIFTASLSNFLIPLCKSPWAMLIIWCINGFAQAMIWPPLVKILTEAMPHEQYKKSSLTVICGSSLGTVAVYLLAPLCIKLGSWKLLFLICGALAFVMSFVWLFAMRKPLRFISSESDELPILPSAKGKALSLGTGGLLMFMLVLFAIMIQGVLKDGITTWMPTLMSEVFHMDSASSVLSGVVLPLFAAISVFITSLINKRFVTNEIACAAVMFFGGFISLALMSVFGFSNRAAVIIFLTLAVSSMHSVNFMLICTLPSRFRNSDCLSFISGLLNTCTYVGSAISTYGIAALTEAHSWHFTVILWSILAFCGMLLCILSIKLCKKLS